MLSGGRGGFPEAGSPPTSPSSPASPVPVGPPSPPPWPDGPAQRKRHMPMAQLLGQPFAGFGGGATISDAGNVDDAAALQGGFSAALRVGSRASGGDEGVAALLPKMKRMRLRPSLGQLRLQREASEVLMLTQELQVCVQPEQLRATVVICGRQDAGSKGCPPAVHLELSFPPQYPHRPPKVLQVVPDEPLPCWQYDGRCVALARLTDSGWSSAMGVADVVRDLVQATDISDRGPRPSLGLQGSIAIPVGLCAGTAGLCARGLAASARMGGPCPRSHLVPASTPTPDDVEMA